MSIQEDTTCQRNRCGCHTSVDRGNASYSDVMVYKNAASHPDRKQLMKVQVTHPMYDPLMYVLMFPFGNKGWEQDYQCGNKECTARQYYKYRLMICGSDSFTTIHQMG